MSLNEIEQLGYKCTINWYRWGKIKTIYLHDACALLAGFDLALYRWEQKDYQHSIGEEEREEKNQNYHPRQQKASESYKDEKRKHKKANRDYFSKLNSIQAVINNYAESKIFINIESREYSVDRLKAEGMTMDKVPAGVNIVEIDTVNLAEFGTWAKSSGYDLPPEFPVVGEPDWSKARKIEKEPIFFLSFACEAYWNSKDGDIKREKLPADIAELKRWLKSTINKDTNEVQGVAGYIVTIDNNSLKIEKEHFESKVIKQSFSTVIKNLNG